MSARVRAAGWVLVFVLTVTGAGPAPDLRVGSAVWFGVPVMSVYAGDLYAGHRECAGPVGFGCEAQHEGGDPGSGGWGLHRCPGWLGHRICAGTPGSSAAMVTGGSR